MLTYLIISAVDRDHQRGEVGSCQKRVFGHRPKSFEIVFDVPRSKRTVYVPGIQRFASMNISGVTSSKRFALAMRASRQHGLSNR